MSHPVVMTIDPGSEQSAFVIRIPDSDGLRAFAKLPKPGAHEDGALDPLLHRHRNRLHKTCATSGVLLGERSALS